MIYLLRILCIEYKIEYKKWDGGFAFINNKSI